MIEHFSCRQIRDVAKNTHPKKDAPAISSFQTNCYQFSRFGYCSNTTFSTELIL